MDEQPVSHDRDLIWDSLQTLAQQAKQRPTLTLFQKPDRFESFSRSALGMLYDFSKQNLAESELDALIQLAKAAELPKWIERQFSGNKINHTENRAVLHTALRSRASDPLLVDGEDIRPDIQQTLTDMSEFVSRIQSGAIRGHTQSTFRDVVNIGIGGSDLGPRFVVDALSEFNTTGLRCHFVSNVDDSDINAVLSKLDPSTTLFVVASKTFTTQETMLNAHTARSWLIDALGNDAVADHFVAVSTNLEAVQTFGIQADRVFQFWDWVGGRFSVWSSVGLSVALSIGADGFREFLDGAEAMDIHFRTTPLEDNLPVLMALIGLWNINFLSSPSLAVLPYDERLSLMPAYLQQLEMESNGKHINRQEQAVDYNTSPIIWGGAGTNVQHSFLQALHQGTQDIPVDFLAVCRRPLARDDHHQTLLANCFAQSEALLKGRQDASLPEHKKMPGNRPSSTLLLDELTPHSLGSLIALYEQKVFVQGVLWNINSFDQWGVELGKELGKQILKELQQQAEPALHDASTNALINAASKRA